MDSLKTATSTSRPPHQSGTPVSSCARLFRASPDFLFIRQFAAKSSKTLQLLRARGRGRYADKHVELEKFSDVVKEIAQDPSTLTPKLLQELPKALTACTCAIILREHVSSFFPEADEGQLGHQHFLQLLKNWNNSLQQIQVEQEEKSTEKDQELELSNYYEVLRVDEDYFQHEQTYVVDKEVSRKVQVNRRQLFEEAFAQDLKMEMVFFFEELDELMEGVCKVYDEVKREQRTLVEATVVTKVAMDTAKALTAQIQLKYPTLKTGEQMFNIVRCMAPEKFRQRMLAIYHKVMADLKISLLSGSGMKAKYVKGMFLADFVSVGSTLNSFRSVIPVDLSTNIKFQENAFGETYEEERTQHYVLLRTQITLTLY